MIQLDKYKHYVAGTIATAVGVTLAGVAGGLVACATAAVGREIYNALTGGKFDVEDIAATMLGCVIPVYTYLI